MKTSASQFELMVSFMEEHGDLTKLSSDASGRLRTLKKWENLTNLLNSDGVGDTKTIDKWKKVWSDFKNNTKKKAARLHKAATGTGGGPAIFGKLTDLEQRVLKLVGVQVATGLPVEEAGLSQQMTSQEKGPPSASAQQIHINPQFPNSCQPTEEYIPSAGPHFALNIEEEENTQAWDMPGPSTRPHIPPVEASFIPEVEVEINLARNETQPSTSHNINKAISSPPHIFEEIQVQDSETFLPTRPVTPAISLCQPALSGQTTPRRARQGQVHVSPRRARPSQVSVSPRHARPTRTRSRELPRRRVRPAHTEEAAQHFLNSDENWRNFRIRQHEDYMENRRELNRIRVMELQTQREWQALGARLIDIFEKFVNKDSSN